MTNVLRNDKCNSVLNEKIKRSQENTSDLLDQVAQQPGQRGATEFTLHFESNQSLLLISTAKSKYN